MADSKQDSKTHTQGIPQWACTSPLHSKQASQIANPMVLIDLCFISYICTDSLRCIVFGKCFEDAHNAQRRAQYAIYAVPTDGIALG